MIVTDPLRQVAAYRPTSTELDREWPADRRAAVWERVRGRRGGFVPAAGSAASEAEDRLGAITTVRATAPAPARRAVRRMGTRGLVAVSLVVAAVAALLLTQLLIPGRHPADAAGLDRLAAAAATGQPLRPGQFRHQVVDSTQNGVTLVQESWTSADGHVWRHDSTGGDSRYYAFPPGQDSINYPSPGFLAGLPTDPVALNRYLRAHVSGSTSTDEAVFVAVQDMLYGGFAPPALRAAALQVLKITPHITVATSHDSLGRSAVKVTFVDPVNRPGETQSLYFNPTSAAMVETQTIAPGLVYTGTVTVQDVVDAVPARVLAGVAQQQANPPTAPMVGGGPSTQAQAGDSSAPSQSAQTMAHTMAQTAAQTMAQTAAQTVAQTMPQPAAQTAGVAAPTG